VVGAFLVVTLQNYLAGTQLPVTVVTGVIFVVCVLLFRRGIVGEIAAAAIRRGGVAAGR
jgi:branched-chain amino acid transport system permease protein